MVRSNTMPLEIPRRVYAEMYGPTVGDRVRLGDTGLVIQIEFDAQERGNEFLAGFGKTARDGLHVRAVTGTVIGFGFRSSPETVPSSDQIRKRVWLATSP